MALAASRVVLAGETPYAHEREAIDFAIGALPNHDPYNLYGLVELLEPSTGRLYEIDLLVIGYAAIYLVEIKSGPGRYEGDPVDWWRVPPGESRRWMEPPLRLANLKAKVLKSRLAAKLGDRTPWVQPLIFLSHPDTQITLEPEGRLGVVTRHDLARAITHHDFKGTRPDWRGQPINTPLMHDLGRALGGLGLRARQGQAFAGLYQLGEVLAEGAGYQDRVAVHREQSTFRRRARIYLVPQATSVERRQQLRRAAGREAQLLHDVREHPSILSSYDFITDAPLGPTVLLDAFDGGQPLSTFLRLNPLLPFFDRVEVVQQVARALAFCHRKGITHGALCPEAVLVRRHRDSGAIETRLFNFQLGAGVDVEGTLHFTDLLADPWALYQAPEVREDPARRSAGADIFSLGALAYFLFTGRPPAESLAQLDERLRRDRHLEAQAADDGISRALGQVIELGTKLSPIERADSAEAWIELLLEGTTQPEPAATPAVDPLLAREGDELESGLQVRAFLGQGSTARVIAVERDGKAFALKVSLGAEQDARLTEEARTLRRLRHPRIVQLHDALTVTGRSCLLMSLAGKGSLHARIAEEGAISLDYAGRWGEDLLAALEYLEDEVHVVHRDIKPANLGVGATGKEAQRLTLFDFSLAGLAATELQVGTSAYRDPFLRQRGAWDFAADRWAAAITLHEMLTGVRPGFGDRQGPALDPDAPLVLAAERFEPTVRDQLVVFFQRALDREADRRFASAKEMRHAWIAALDERRAGAPSPDGDAPELPQLALTDVGLDTPVAALPLSSRARNALDRAGLARAGELLALPDNRLSAIRGIGTEVAKEILRFRNRWRVARALAPVEARPFFVGYRGEDLPVDAAGLPPAAAVVLQDAGLTGLRLLADADAAQVAALAGRASTPVETLSDPLEAENRKADERDHPTTLEGWVESLLPASAGKKRGESGGSSRYLRPLLGLAEPFAGRLDVLPRQVADHLKVTPANIYIQLGKARDTWQKRPAVAELRSTVRALLEAAGGALPLERAADELRALLPHDRTAAEGLLRAQAAALVRVVAEVERGEPTGLRYVRLRDDAPWVFASEAHADATERLAAVADDLAARPVLASPGEAARALAEVTAGTPLAGLVPDRLAALATAAGRRAALSTRLEIYPPGLGAGRALELCAAVLGVQATEEELRQRVRARYPAAEELPPRPELDRLLAGLKPRGLCWDDQNGCFCRPGENEETNLHTQVRSSEALIRAREHLPRLPAPEALAARDFAETIRATLERRSFRVLSVSADRRAADAALQLEETFRLRRVCLDQALIEEADGLAQQHGIPEEALHDTDRLGREGTNWGDLRNVMIEAARRLATRLLPAREPLLLVQPGLLARYQLDEFLKRVLEAARQEHDCAAIFLLVPGHDNVAAARINGQLDVPGILPGQVLRIPREWLESRDAAVAA